MSGFRAKTSKYTVLLFYCSIVQQLVFICEHCGEAQEASSYQPSVRPERRHRIPQELSSTSAAAFQILTAALQQPGTCVNVASDVSMRRAVSTIWPVTLPDAMSPCHHVKPPDDKACALHCAGGNVKPSVCRAFASWLRLTVDPFPAEAAQHLVHMVLEGLASKDTFDSAVDAVVEVIYRTAMWLERRQLSPEWHAIVQAVLQVVRLVILYCLRPLVAGD